MTAYFDNGKWVTVMCGDNAKMISDKDEVNNVRNVFSTLKTEQEKNTYINLLVNEGKK